MQRCIVPYRIVPAQHQPHLPFWVAGHEETLSDNNLLCTVAKTTLHYPLHRVLLHTYSILSFFCIHSVLFLECQFFSLWSEHINCCYIPSILFSSQTAIFLAFIILDPSGSVALKLLVL